MNEEAIKKIEDMVGNIWNDIHSIRICELGYDAEAQRLLVKAITELVEEIMEDAEVEGYDE